jgi:hypothetical protein
MPHLGHWFSFLLLLKLLSNNIGFMECLCMEVQMVVQSLLHIIVFLHFYFFVGYNIEVTLE